MKKPIVNLLISLLLIFIITSCKLDGSSYTNAPVIIPLTNWELPDTSKVSTPFGLTLNASLTSSCTHNLVFGVNEVANFKKKAFATAVYENSGENCNPVELPFDSTIVITPTSAGKYYYYFLTLDEEKKALIYSVDSIIIIP